MNSTQNIPGLEKAQELRGVLVSDAMVLRDGIAGSKRKRTASTLANGYFISQVTR